MRDQIERLRLAGPYASETEGQTFYSKTGPVRKVRVFRSTCQHAVNGLLEIVGGVELSGD